MADNSNSNSNSTTSSSLASSREEESTIFRAIPLRSEGLAALQPLTPLSFSGVQPLNQKRSLASTTPSKTTSESQQWKVSAEEIPRVPDYPLEQTSLSMDKQVSLEQITERISRVLQAQSLICSYQQEDDDNDDMDYDDEERLPGRVDCTSQDKQLKFVVQVYRNLDDSYCVEMQRRRGSSLEFSAIRRPLFQTLQTGEVQRSVAPKWSSSPAFIPNKKFRVMPCTPLSRA